MYIAMNRFKVIKGSEGDFEQIWRSRKSYLNELPGFIEFSLLKGPEREDHTLYASHTVWATKEQFVAWTNSEQFRASHARAGQGKPTSIGHPEFEGFEAVLIDDNRPVASAAAE
ncbi:MAG: antibiotic biosynthesis monooxygenase family protein [Phreatobacter sp.]